MVKLDLKEQISIIDSSQDVYQAGYKFLQEEFSEYVPFDDKNKENQKLQFDFTWIIFQSILKDKNEYVEFMK